MSGELANDHGTQHGPMAGRDRLVAVQAMLESLASRVESDPSGVLTDVEPLLAETAAWPRLDASLWCAYLTAQALRFLDNLEPAVLVAQGGLQVAGVEYPSIRPHLELEAGSSLNQAGEQVRAEGYLRDAVEGFRALDDKAGEAWALTALADSLCGLSQAAEAGEIATEAFACARASGDVRIELRALKQLAVVNRQLGRTAEALAAIDDVLARLDDGHSRGNALLEHGHVLVQAQDLRAAEESFLQAATIYHRFDDPLGLANVYRALGNSALLIGRYTDGVEHLERAATIYEQINNRQGLGYTLRDLAVVALSAGDLTRAKAEATRAVDCFRETQDLLGLTGALRASARVAYVEGRAADSEAALTEAGDAAARSDSPLAVAGVALLRAEFAANSTTRRDAGRMAASAYAQVGVSLGVAHAKTFEAEAAMEDADLDEVIRLVRVASVSLHDARKLVADGARRADLDFTSRDVTQKLLGLLWDVCRNVDSEPSVGEEICWRASMLAADIVLNDLPLGMRQALADGQPGPAARDVVERIRRVKSSAASTVLVPPHLTQQLAVALTNIDPEQEVAAATLMDLAPTGADTATLLIGAPTSDRQVPVCFAVGDAAPAFVMVDLGDDDVDDIDALGRSGDTDVDYERLVAQSSKWPVRLGERLFPDELRAWTRTAGATVDVDCGTTSSEPQDVPGRLRIFLSSALAHLPIEALQVDEVPLGVRVAVERIPAPASRAPLDPQLNEKAQRAWTAYFDDDLSWQPERKAVERSGGATLVDEVDVRKELGPNRLVLVGSHGSSGMGLTGCLQASDGTVLLDAADLLAKPLTGSVLVLESCWSGRYVGPRTGEQLSLATLGLLAGADAVVAGLFGLPADDDCTGRIVGILVSELSAGTAPPEALRRAREEYWFAGPVIVRRPRAAAAREPADSPVMAGRAPLAWAGLCVWTRAT